MNKQKVIIFSVLGLACIGVILLFVNAAKNANSENETTTIAEDDAMTTVPQKFTYKDMMEAQGNNGFDYSDSIREKRVVDDQEETPDFTAPANKPASIQEETEDNNMSEAIREIQQVKKDLKKPIPETVNSTNLQTEDALLQEYSNQSTGKANNKPISAPISEVSPSGGITIASAPVKSKKGFNSLKFGDNKPAGKGAIRGVILNDVQVTSGYTVSIMLLEGINLNGVQFQRNKVVSGVVNVQAPRIFINIPGAEVDGNLTNVTFSVFDVDGLEGLKAKDNSAGKAANQVIKDEVSSEVEGRAPGVLGGAIRIIKSLGSQGNATEAVMIPGGHKVILKMLSTND